MFIVRKIIKYSLLIWIVTFFSCKDDYSDDNTFLPNVSVNFTINLNLPEGNTLLTNGFKIFPDKGIRGVIVFNNGLNKYRSFDLACPHVPLENCSTMLFTQSDLYMQCSCDNEQFSKIDGSAKNGNIQQVAREYIVSKSGNILHVRN